MDRHGGCTTRSFRRNLRALLQRSIVVLITPILVVFSGPSATLLLGQEGPAPVVQPGSGSESLLSKLNKRGNLTLKETSITDAIYTISETWDINIVVQSDISGQVNGVFKQAPLKEILDSLLLINGYSYRPVGESLVVMSLSEVGQFSPLFATAIVSLRYGVPEEILPAVDILKSPRGRVQTIASSRSLMVVDFPQHVEMIRKHAIELDNAAGRQAGTLTSASGAGGGHIEVGHFAPQYVRAMHLEKMVTDLLSEDGKSSVIEKENRIVVADYPEKVRLVADAIRHLDVPRKQVRIAAIIYDISLEDIEEIGINWDSALKGNNLDGAGNPQDVFSIDSITQVPPPLGAANGILTFMSLSRNFDITAVVNALQQSDDSRLLADPNVTVLDNDQAKIEIVTEIPYQALTQTSGGGNIGTTSFREAGVKLEVTPRIAADGTIEMDVTPSFSRLTGFTPGDNQPIIDRRETSTTIRVADQQTIVIGGLRQRTDIGDFQGIPILKDIPIAGKLFKNRETTVRESELVVFITPMIVPYDECPSGRYGAALETADCWLHRVPWAEGCPPVDYPGGAGDCQDCQVCEGEHHVYGSQELIYEDDRAVQPQRLPEVEAPVRPPSDNSAMSSRRRSRAASQPVTINSNASTARFQRATPTTTPNVGEQVRVSSSQVVSPKPPRPVLAQVRDTTRPKTTRQNPPASTRIVPRETKAVEQTGQDSRSEEIPRIKLARGRGALPHHAPAGAGHLPRRLPPVVALTQYQTETAPSPQEANVRPATRRDSTATRQPTVSSQPAVTTQSARPRQPAVRKQLTAPRQPARTQPTAENRNFKRDNQDRTAIDTLLDRQPDPFRKPYGDRFRTPRNGVGQSLLDSQPSQRLPPTARNPSVSPEEAARRATGESKHQPPAFDAFWP